MYLYHLKLNEYGLCMQKDKDSKDSYNGVTEMVISAENDMRARVVAGDRERDEDSPNVSTRHMWGISIESQLLYVSCTLIGTSLLPRGLVSATEQHTGAR